MPLYDYHCPKCAKLFEILVPLKDSKTPVLCKYCQEQLKKIIRSVMFRIH
jgi:putative FmdB family regulatory protein